MIQLMYVFHEVISVDALFQITMEVTNQIASSLIANGQYYSMCYGLHDMLPNVA